MQGNLIVVGMEQAGTLTANFVKRISFPVGVTLIAVNASCDNTTGFDLDVGTAADTDAYIDAYEVIGAAATSTDIPSSSFVAGAPQHIPAGTEVHITADFDATGSSDAAAVNVHLFFREG